MNTDEILQKLNAIKPVPEISFQLKLTSSLLNFVITCPKDSDFDKRICEKISLEAMNILIDANLVGIKAVQFYGRKAGEQPFWRIVQKLPEPLPVLESIDQEDFENDSQDENPFVEVSQPNLPQAVIIRQNLFTDHESEDSNAQFTSPLVTDIQKLSQLRKTYQFIQIRVQLLGRGMTNEIMSLYVNGKRVKPRTATFHDFLNYLGSQGFQVVTASLETEGVYTHFYTLQREVLTNKLPNSDILSDLDHLREGADFGDSVKNFFEWGVDRFA